MQKILSEKTLEQERKGHFRRLKALLIKESYQIARDYSTFLISVVLPLILMFLYGFGVSLDLDHLRIGLVLEDTAPDAQSFAKAMTNSPYFDVKIVHDRRELLEDITSGAIRGFVVVPSYFSDFRKKPGVVAPIQVIADGSEPNTATFVQNYVQGAFSKWLIQEQMEYDDVKGLPLITTEPRFWYNEQLESRYFLLSGSLAIIMTLIGTLLTALVVAREWERGTMEAMISTPISIREIVFGKVIPYYFLGMVSMTICVLVSVLGYGLPLRGSILVLALVTTAFLFCALNLGLMISSLSKNQTLAYQIAVVSGFLPAYILSGFLFEIGSMPKWIQLITYIIPAKYFVTSLQTLFLVGNIWGLIIRSIIPMILIGCIFLFITARNTVKRLE